MQPPWTVASQAPLSMGFSRQEYWGALPCPLQGIYPTQGSNLCLLHCRQFLYLLSHQGSPTILKCVVYPFCRGSSRPKNWTRNSCIAGRFFTSCATGEAHIIQVITEVGQCGADQHKGPLCFQLPGPNILISPAWASNLSLVLSIVSGGDSRDTESHCTKWLWACLRERAGRLAHHLRCCPFQCADC